jgi:hypothetical protein
MTVMDQDNIERSPDSGWKILYKVGGVAALIAGVIFRRNLGPEISLFVAQKQPDTIVGWFTLLQNNKFLGLTYLNIFDIVDYVLVGLMFLALYVALRRFNRSCIAIATLLGLMGIAVYFASNTAFSVLSLSDQYAAATTDAQKSLFLAAGQAVLAINQPVAPYQGTGIYMSLLLQAIAGLIISVVMLRSKVFSKVTAYVGILASAFDLVYCITFAFVPGIDVYLLSAAGLFLFIWHILIGLRLCQLGWVERYSVPQQ